MEYIKTQLQLQKGVVNGQAPPFKGVVDGLTYTVRTTGFFSLYRGLGVTLVISIYFDVDDILLSGIFLSDWINTEGGYSLWGECLLQTAFSR